MMMKVKRKRRRKRKLEGREAEEEGRRLSQPAALTGVLVAVRWKARRVRTATATDEIVPSRLWALSLPVSLAPPS
jgi:hypothetical protein